MQNLILKLRQGSIISKESDFLYEKLKLWLAPSTKEFNIVFWNFAHVFYLPMSKKGCSGFFLFCLDLEFLIRM